ncbi:MAG: ribosome biogenesis GTPase Der [Polyangiaceae bacterium]
MKPIVAIVGRPNVGKSTLFNRLTASRKAIVHDRPGVTRDRHYGDATFGDRAVTVIDTGGFDPTSDDSMKRGIKRQIELAIAEADVILCVFDATEAATATDHAELELLRVSGKPVVFAANKADAPKSDLDANDYFRLGIEKLITVSALHGRNINDLIDELEAALPPLKPGEAPVAEDEEDDEDDEAGDEEAADSDAKPARREVPAGPPRVAIIGRPNAGKSSLLNRLLGEERMLVDDQPGTTRDAIDATVTRKGKTYIFVDTAGIRRKAKVHKAADQVEAVSVVQAIRAMEHCDVVVLVADAAEGVSEQDAKILGLAVERGRAVVVALNKTDLLDKKELEKAEEDARDKLSFAPWSILIPMSVKAGRGTDKLMAAIDRAGESFKKRVGTGELNRFFETVLLSHPPPTKDGRAPRLYFITQAETRPPTFVVQSSAPEAIHFSYQRYVANQIRKTFAFEGVPLIVHYRRRRRAESPRGRGASKSQGRGRRSEAK